MFKLQTLIMQCKIAQIKIKVLQNKMSTANTPARRRLLRDFKRLQTDPPEGISGTPCDNNLFLWHAVIFG